MGKELKELCLEVIGNSFFFVLEEVDRLLEFIGDLFADFIP
jgi:hypothetical protein